VVWMNIIHSLISFIFHKSNTGDDLGRENRPRSSPVLDLWKSNTSNTGDDLGRGNRPLKINALFIYNN
jgi:hypothetical protein